MQVILVSFIKKETSSRHPSFARETSAYILLPSTVLHDSP